MVQSNTQHPQRIKCEYFTWLLSKRGGVYQADGRGNHPSTGRHSLTTRHNEQALKNLQLLDKSIAIELGLAAPIVIKNPAQKVLTLETGNEEYQTYVARPRSLKGVGTATQKRYRAIFSKAIPFFEHRNIDTWNEVTEDQLQAYVTFLDKQGYAHATQVMEIVTLKQAINHWIEKGLLPVELRFKLEIDKVTESTTYCFTDVELKTMIRHCGENNELSWLGDVIVALAFSGMRIGELAQLRWSAVSAGCKTISIVDDSRSGNSRGSRRTRTTKNGKSRSIPTGKELRQVLNRLQEKSRSGFVFRAPQGGRLHSRNVLQVFIDEVIEPLKTQFPEEVGETGFSSGRLHSLRHYFCSQCANRGVSEQALMTWLGHSSSAMVKRYYHLNSEEAQRQISKLDQSSSA